MSELDDVEEPMLTPAQLLDEIDKTVADLHVLWDKIGFDEESKATRQAIFFRKLLETCQDIYDAEEELEEKICESIKTNRFTIRNLCIDLNLKYDDDYAKGKTMLEEDKMLSDLKKQYQSIKTERLEHLKELVYKEHQLCEQLKTRETIIKSKVPSDTELDGLKSRIKELEELLIKRKKEMEKYKHEAMRLCDELESDSINDNIIYLSVDELPLGEDDLHDAKQLVLCLQAKLDKIHETIRSLKFKIRQLWTKLDINNVELAEMVNDNSIPEGSKSDLLMCLNDEHERCIKIKMENMQKFIVNIRHEILSYYAKLYMSDDEIKEFKANFDDINYTEALLKLHEDKLEDLKFKYEENVGLYERIDKWMNLWDEFLAFEERTKDPNRFKTRGYNSLQEEKLRKEFNTQFPKLENEIASKANEFEELNQSHFSVYGFKWCDYVSQVKQSYQDRKANEKREKQIVKDQIKLGEMKYGSKAATPLSRLGANVSAIKRKNDCTSHTPSILMKTSKIARTDDTQSTIMRTPKATIASRIVNKSKNIKRKSKTPNNLLKTRRQQTSKLVSASSKSNAASSTLLDGTVKSSMSNTKLSSTKSSVRSNENDGTLISTCSSTISTSTKITSSTRGYPFQNVNTNEISYVQFSQELNTKKPFRFGHELSGANGSNQAMKEKEKLMSTLIKE